MFLTRFSYDTWYLGVVRCYWGMVGTGVRHTGSGPVKVLNEGFSPDAAIGQGKEQGSLDKIWGN